MTPVTTTVTDAAGQRTWRPSFPLDVAAVLGPLRRGRGDPTYQTGADGALWLTENAANKIARSSTAGAVTEYPIPTPGSQLTYGIAAQQAEANLLWPMILIPTFN